MRHCDSATSQIPDCYIFLLAASANKQLIYSFLVSIVAPKTEGNS